MKDAMKEAVSVGDGKAMLRKAEEQIAKLTCELKEREAEKAFYIQENAFLKESLRRLLGV